jgi:hypothetical protein
MAAFHGDTFFQEIIRQVIKTTGIKVAIETGTYHGDSSLFLEELGLSVFTCEKREDYFNHAKARFDGKHIVPSLGDSRPFLRATLLGLKDDIFVFLDAHWQDDWPLKEELDILIADSKNKVIIIDDFDVPNSRMTGSAGGGGTPGDPLYGPRLKTDLTPCSLETFGKQLAYYRQVWFPDYNSDMPGYCIATDLDLTSIAQGLRLRRHM